MHSFIKRLFIIYSYQTRHTIMKKFTQLKKLSLVAISALALSAAIGGVASAAPCLVPTFDCPLFNCD